MNDVDQQRSVRQSVLHYFEKHPEGSVKEAAKAISKSQTDVQVAVNWMKKQKWLSNNWVVFPEALGFKYLYRVDIWVSPIYLTENSGGLDGDAVPSQKGLAEYISQKLVPKNEHWQKHILVQDVHVVLGSAADLSATIRSKNPRTMQHFVTEGLRRCTGIAKTSTFQLDAVDNEDLV